MTTLRHVDIRGLGYCNRGARAWFRARGFDWSAFLRDGLPVEELEGIDDQMVRDALDRARAREAGER